MNGFEVVSTLFPVHQEAFRADPHTTAEVCRFSSTNKADESRSALLFPFGDQHLTILLQPWLANQEDHEENPEQ